MRRTLNPVVTGYSHASCAVSRRNQRMALGRLHLSATRPEPWAVASRRDRVLHGSPNNSLSCRL